MLNYAGKEVSRHRNVKAVEAKNLISDNTKSSIGFIVAAVVLSPKLAFEDILRACKVKVPENGIFYNSEEKNIMQIWRESKPVSQASEDEMLAQF